MKFKMGSIVCTPAAIEAFEKTDELILLYVQMHGNLEQGVLDDADQRANELAVKNGSRVFSAFNLSDGTKIWIITEADRSSTCVLLPSDY